MMSVALKSQKLERVSASFMKMAFILFGEGGDNIYFVKTFDLVSERGKCETGIVQLRNVNSFIKKCIAGQVRL